jgi:hypothetical protein
MISDHVAYAADDNNILTGEPLYSGDADGCKKFVAGRAGFVIVTTEDSDAFLAANGDQDAWDRQIERDASAGKLDRLGEAALRDVSDGKFVKGKLAP